MTFNVSDLTPRIPPKPPADRERELRLEKAAEEAHRAIEEMQAAKGRWRGACSDCKHVSWSHGYYCLNPIVAPPRLVPTTGKMSQPSHGCHETRVNGVCGPDGLLFEPRSYKPSAPEEKILQPFYVRRRLLLVTSFVVLSLAILFFLAP